MGDLCQKVGSSDSILVEEETKAASRPCEVPGTGARHFFGAYVEPDASK